MGNATEAARLAGYRGNDVTLAASGHENLRKPQISEAVSERADTALKGMCADEVIECVAKIARSEDERTLIGSAPSSCSASTMRCGRTCRRCGTCRRTSALSTP
jgi:hypothetical protein